MRNLLRIFRNLSFLVCLFTSGRGAWSLFLNCPRRLPGRFSGSDCVRLLTISELVSVRCPAEDWAAAVQKKPGRGGLVCDTYSPRAHPTRWRWFMVKKALWVELNAKPGKEKELEDFLKSAQPLAEREKDTVSWYAVKMGPANFGILDRFADDSGRDAHL